jgi:hypothetical protein
MKPYILKASVINTERGQVIKYLAIIRKCARRGIRVRRQKTIKLRTVAPEYTRSEMGLSIERELDRWAEKKLKSQPPLAVKEVL